MQGTVLDGRYLLGERIGSGGMGTVWRARDRRLARDVAVKTLTGLARTEEDAGRLAERFQREARAAARLASPSMLVTGETWWAVILVGGVIWVSATVVMTVVGGLARWAAGVWPAGPGDASRGP